MLFISEVNAFRFAEVVREEVVYRKSYCGFGSVWGFFAMGSAFQGRTLEIGKAFYVNAQERMMLLYKGSAFIGVECCSKGISAI